MKKIILFGLSLVFAGVTAKAQSLVLVHADMQVDINSTYVNDYSAEISLKNNSNTSNDYIVRRKVYNTNACAFDSSYFCWDLCYGSSVNQSFGTVNIVKGATNNYFSGHVYSKNNGSSCTDSIAYTFINDANGADSLRVVIHFNASGIFSLTENGKPFVRAFPNPANSYFVVELGALSNKKTTVAVYNMVGSKVQEVAATSNRVEINTNNLPNGVYLYSVIVNGKAVDTKKIVIKH